MTPQRYIFLSLLAAVLTVALSSCGTRSDAAEKHLKVAYLPITHALPLIAATEADSAVEAVKFGSWTELADAFNSGHVDAAVMLAPMAVRCIEKGVPMKIVSLAHRSGNVIVSANDITNPAQLKGKSVAIPHRLSSHNLLLRQLLQQANLTLDDVNVIEMPPPEMPAALASGQIAAYIVAEPFGSIGVEKGVGHVLADGESLWPSSVCCVLVVRNSSLKHKSEAVSELMKAYAQAGDKIQHDSHFALQEARKLLKADDTVLARSIGITRFDSLQFTPEHYAKLTRLMTDAALINNEIPNYNDVTDKK